MKRTLALMLALMLLFSLTACSTSDGPTTTIGTANNTGAADVLDTTSSVDTTTAEISFQEVVVVDNEYCTIKITGIDPENMWGYTLKAYLENKSSDKTYMFSVTSASINGVTFDPFFAAEVAAGKKANESISFSDSTLDEDIGAYTDIELNFRVYDYNDWTADPVATSSINIYPYGEEKAVSYTRETLDTDTVVLDNEQVTVIVTGYEQDEILGYSAKLFLVNKTDTSIMFSADEVSVNGFMVDPLFAHSVEAGKCAFSSMSWFESTLADNGITDVETIEFALRVYDINDWLADDFANETITLNP